VHTQSGGAYTHIQVFYTSVGFEGFARFAFFGSNWHYYHLAVCLTYDLVLYIYSVTGLEIRVYP
jgi:hypothetical protein